MPNFFTQPLLSVSITTYNRPEYLRQCLDSIVSQFADREVASQTEVVISDNAGSSETPGLVSTYLQHFSNIVYMRHQSNVGFDENIINSIVISHGRYCWYMSDDDMLAPGSLLIVINLLKKYSPALLTLNTLAFSKPEELTANHSGAKSQPVFITVSTNEFIKKGFCIGVVSTFVFDRQLWMQTDFRNYQGGWAYYEIIFKLLSIKQGRILLHMFDTLLWTRTGSDWVANPEGYGGAESSWAVAGSEIFAHIHWKQLLKILPDYNIDLEWVSSEIAGVNRNLPLILLRAKGHGLKCSRANFKQIWYAFSDSYLYLSVAAIIFLIPNFLIRSVRDFRKMLCALTA